MSSVFCLDILRCHVINSFDFFKICYISSKRLLFVRYRNISLSVKPQTAETLLTGQCGTEGLNWIVRVGQWVDWLLYALRSREIEHRADWGWARLCVFVSVVWTGCKICKNKWSLFWVLDVRAWWLVLLESLCRNTGIIKLTVTLYHPPIIIKKMYCS